MSLLSEAMQNFKMQDKTTSADGEGGFIVAYTDGATFQAAITLDTSMEARIAEKQGVTAKYTVTTRKTTVLMYHDVIKRVSDNKLFRITSDGDDKATPSSSSLNIRQVTAEEYVI